MNKDSLAIFLHNPAVTWAGLREFTPRMHVQVNIVRKRMIGCQRINKVLFLGIEKDKHQLG